MDVIRGVVGIAALLAIAYAFSTDRKAIRPRIVLTGLAAQAVLAFLVIRVEPLREIFNWFAACVTRLLGFSRDGAAFIFNDLAGTDAPFVFVVQVLPTIVFFASLMAVLYHLGVMQILVTALANAMRRVIGVSGAEAMAAASNVFVGQTEAPLCIKPYLAGMTRSQVMLVMTCGFATIAGSVLGMCVGLVAGNDQDAQLQFAKHLITASVMSAPGAFVMAKILLPETTDVPDETAVVGVHPQQRQSVNVLDAAAAGATDGLRLAMNVAAMLVAFVAMIALIDWPLSALGETSLGNTLEGWLGLDELSLTGLLGVAFSPIAALIGIQSADATTVGGLLGTSMVATELVAYERLGGLIREDAISQRSAAITAYALCGFANFPSIAIQIGGLTAIAPERRADFSRIGLRAMFAGSLTCWMTGCIAGIFL